MVDKSSPNVLVVDLKLPEPDRDSGSLRMFNLLLVLKGLCGRLTFASRTTFQATVYSQKLESAGIRLLREPVREYLRQTEDNYDLVILSRPSNARDLFESMHNKYPRARIIFDTVDLHHLRLYREARLTRNVRALQRALVYKQQETSLAEIADCTLVVSAYEQEIMTKLCPGADIRIVSNIHEIIPTRRELRDRKDIFFIGSFYHRPNIDAVQYYVSQIHPKLVAYLPGIKCYIIGENPPPDIRLLASTDLVVEGYVNDIEPYFETCRLSIAPLRYGAGVKGKVLLSMSHGVPVVGTPTAAEGIPENGGTGILVVDSAGEFCSAIQRIYDDPELWEALSIGGMRTIRDHFSSEAARLTLEKLFIDFGF